MARKKIKHTQIPNERVRKSTLKKRLESLYKKANELSILCDVEMFIVIHNPNEGNSTLWPSQEKAMNGILKFLTFPEKERLKKMVLQEKFLSEKVQDMAETLLNLQNKNDETEMGFLMNQLIIGKTFDELDSGQLNGLYHFVDEKLKKLKNRSDEIDETRNSGPFARTSIIKPMDNMSGDMFFSGTMAGIQKNLGPEPTEVMSSFTEGNQGGLLDEFNQVWPTIFSP
ncbi:hypothetical protein DH2020_046876 [Rehmannia glutinosa]|uniref:MADS-box domain-containing protein n=1 Tax=Rehmannia glutinosa TaxID=99300 RepID=A0ABR0UBN0_REHGL